MLVFHVIIKSMCSLLLAKGYSRVTKTETNAAHAQKQFAGSVSRGRRYRYFDYFSVVAQ